MKPLGQFLREDAGKGELCVIRDAGHVVQTAYIDSDGLFAVHPVYVDRLVSGDSWGRMPVTGEYGRDTFVPCHYIDLAGR